MVVVVLFCGVVCGDDGAGGGGGVGRFEYD